MALIEDTPYLMLVSYLMPPAMGILVAGCILELARIWLPHCQDEDHTYDNLHMQKHI
jgi:hypothetical protein